MYIINKLLGINNNKQSMKIFTDIKAIKKTLAEILDINKQALQMTLENRALIRAHMEQQIRIGELVEAELIEKSQKNKPKEKKAKAEKTQKKSKKRVWAFHKKGYTVSSKDIAEKVKLFRKQTKRSQEKFGELFGMNQGEVSGVERRAKGIKKAHIDRLENFFAQK
jgi:DNA-binding transcriptional regulator YiaG